MKYFVELNADACLGRDLRIDPSILIEDMPPERKARYEQLINKSQREELTTEEEEEAIGLFVGDSQVVYVVEDPRAARALAVGRR